MNAQNKATLFYVEDDEALSFLTVDGLTEKGYSVDHFSDGKEALDGFRKKNYDLCILDVMLPKIDGFSIAKKIRLKNKHIPIIFLTAKSLKEDKIKGLTIGGDDYITKPYAIEELLLKIDIFLQRSKKQTGEEQLHFEFGKFTFDYQQLQLINEKNSDTLTQKEADLLRFLLLNRDKIVKRSDILINVWGQDDYFLGRSLDVFISRLRKYLKKDDSILLDNVHGVGFVLRTEN